MCRIIQKTMSDGFTDLHQLSERCEVIQLPLISEKEEASAMIGEMEEIKKRFRLVALRGGRQTDLTRPLSFRVQAQLLNHCPTLVAKIQEMEKMLRGWAPALFLRAVKLDAARVSSTSPSVDLSDTNWHFDAGPTNIFDGPDSVPQFYLNLGSQPRHFRIFRATLPEMLEALANTTLGISKRNLAIWPAEQILAIYQTNTPDAPIEEVNVPSGSLTVFDGRRFAHDAGKWQTQRRNEETEADLVAALDLKSNLTNQVLCRTNLSFLEDRL